MKNFVVWIDNIICGYTSAVKRDVNWLSIWWAKEQLQLICVGVTVEFSLYCRWKPGRSFQHFYMHTYLYFLHQTYILVIKKLALKLILVVLIAVEEICERFTSAVHKSHRYQISLYLCSLRKYLRLLHCWKRKLMHFHKNKEKVGVFSFERTFSKCA